MAKSIKMTVVLALGLGSLAALNVSAESNATIDWIDLLQTFLRQIIIGNIFLLRVVTSWLVLPQQGTIKIFTKQTKVDTPKTSYKPIL